MSISVGVVDHPRLGAIDSGLYVPRIPVGVVGGLDDAGLIAERLCVG